MAEDPSDRSPAVAAAAEALYGAPLRGFVDERKRLAGELRKAGDKAAAAAVAKLPRPSMSAWVVNQLHRQVPDEVEALFDAGARLREGDFSASAAQRAALAGLRGRAAEILQGDGHAASEGTLGRVQTTLQALSALGGFDPDPPGQLIGDRDPPGFEAMAGWEAPDRPAPAEAPAPAKPAGPDRAAVRAEARAKAESDAAERAREREAERAAAELRRLEKLAERAHRELEERERDVDRLRADLQRAEAAADEARGVAGEADRAVEEAREAM